MTDLDVCLCPGGNDQGILGPVLPRDMWNPKDSNSYPSTSNYKLFSLDSANLSLTLSGVLNSDFIRNTWGV